MTGTPLPDGQRGRGQDRVEGDLERQEDGPCRGDRRPGLAHVGRRQGRVGARSDGDAVLAVGRDEDQSGPGGPDRVADHEFRADPIGRPARRGPLGKDVPPDPGDQGHVASRSCGADGLIGPLAAGGHEELAAQHGLARPGDAIQPDDHVGVRAADDDELRLHRWRFSAATIGRRPNPVKTERIHFLFNGMGSGGRLRCGRGPIDFWRRIDKIGSF